ncbi:hypothetical protein T4C_1471 [Trichinella pseudospiralis]|uniref:Uncharacterized protein n=1 Tax=Trichinella pseudospiralis TaxID=6337 RepID=A0A0V1GIJ6_TRIPS|nr:hypothetical protein T4C_1471 [Trichinella pseudospiralis]
MPEDKLKIIHCQQNSYKKTAPGITKYMPCCWKNGIHKGENKMDFQKRTAKNVTDLIKVLIGLKHAAIELCH